MNHKFVSLATLLALFASPLFAAPLLNITPVGVQAGTGNWVWDVSVTPDLTLAGDDTPLAVELGFQLNAPLVSVTNLDPTAWDTVGTGIPIFGWETKYSDANNHPVGIEANCTGCTITNGATIGAEPATIVSGTANQIFAAMGSVDFTTPGAKQFLQIVTQGPGSGGPASSSIQWLGAYNGGQGRIAQTAGTFDLYSGTLTQTYTPTSPNFYFDVNGATVGSGVADGGAYSWEAANWNNNVPAGDAAATNYIDGNFPRFAASNDANGSYTVTMNANHTCVGIILEDGALNSTLTINGTGTLGIDGGVAQGFIVRGGSNLKILNSIGGSGGVDFQSSGGTGVGSLYLYGNNTYQGGTVVDTAGGLNFNNNNSFGAGPISWGVASQVIADPDASAPITLANTMTTLAASTLTYVGPATAPVTFTNAWTLAAGVSTLSIGNATFPSSQMTISGAVGGSGGSLTKAGVGTLVLSSANTYDGGTTLDNGQLQLGNKAALGPGPFTIGGATPTPTIALSASVPLRVANAVANTVSVNSDFTIAGSNDLELSGPINLGALDRTVTVTNTGVTTFSGVISGTGGLVKAGAGTLALSGANTYSGSTNINGGTLIPNGSESFANSPIINVNNGGTLEMAEAQEIQSNQTFSVFGGGKITAGFFYLNGTLKITGGGNVSSDQVTFGNSMSAAIANVGGGSGGSSWNLSGVTMVRGTINIKSGGSVSADDILIGYESGLSTTINVGDGFGTAFLNCPDITVGDGGPGTLNINAGGTVTTVTIDIGDALNINGGTLRITQTGSSFSTINLLSGSGTIDVPNSGTTATVDGKIIGSGGLTKTGVGTLLLPTENNFNGTTTVNGGTLALSGAGSFASSPTINVNSGGTLDVTAVNGGANFTNGMFKVLGSQTVNVVGGGTLTSGGLILEGTANIDGADTATWSGGRTYVGGTGTGTLMISDGGSVTFQYASIGDGVGSTGIVAVGGGTLSSMLSVTSNDFFYVGNSGIGTLSVTGGGTVSSQSNVILGYNSTGTGTVSVGGGTENSLLTSPDNMAVGFNGSGTMNITHGGTVHTDAGFDIGYYAASTGTVNVGDGMGSSTLTIGGTLNVGNLGIGALNITGGGTVSALQSDVDGSAVDRAHVNVGGGSGNSQWTVSNILYVGNQGNGALNITGGGSVSSSAGYLGYESGSNGTATVGGGTGNASWTDTGILYVGVYGKGTLNITGGDSVTSSGRVTSGEGHIGNFGGSNGTVAVGGGLGNSTWIINSGDLYVAAVGAGTLNITGGGSVSTSGNVYIGNNSGGIGTANVGGGTGASSLLCSGNLHVGESGIGNLSITGGGKVTVGVAYSQNSSSMLAIELSNALAQPGNVPLAITGSASLAGTLEIDPAAGFVPTSGETFDILTALGGVSGTFSSVNGGWDVDGHNVGFTTVYDHVANKVMIRIDSVISAVPGDYNGNGVVDAADYVLWRSGGPLQNEAASIGVVDHADYDFWRAHFGNNGSSGSSLGGAANVPEPASIWLAVVGVALLSGRCRTFA